MWISFFLTVFSIRCICVTTQLCMPFSPSERPLPLCVRASVRSHLLVWQSVCQNNTCRLHGRFLSATARHSEAQTHTCAFHPTARATLAPSFWGRQEIKRLFCVSSVMWLRWISKKTNLWGCAAGCHFLWFVIYQFLKRLLERLKCVKIGEQRQVLRDVKRAVWDHWVSASVIFSFKGNDKEAHNILLSQPRCTSHLWWDVSRRFTSKNSTADSSSSSKWLKVSLLFANIFPLQIHCVISLSTNNAEKIKSHQILTFCNVVCKTKGLHVVTWACHKPSWEKTNK